MMNYQGKQKECKYGLNCKFGFNCKFYHPQREIYLSGYEQNPFYHVLEQEQQVQSLNQQLYSMNLDYDQSNQPFLNNQFEMNDAQYQQQLYEQPVVPILSQSPMQNQLSQQNYLPLLQKQIAKQYYPIPHHFKQGYTSDSNSDMQSDEQEEQKQKKPTNNKFQHKIQEKLHFLHHQDKIKKQNKKSYHQQHCKKPLNQQSYYLYAAALCDFFQKRKIKMFKRQAILRFLAKQTVYDPSVVETIIPMVEQLESEGLIVHFCYKKFIKTIVKENFEMEAVRAKLMKKVNVDMKRKNRDELLYKKFPNPVDVEFLQSNDLLENHETTNNAIYLIDGNNCLTTQKHLRFFFQQKDDKAKAEAQIRFRWLISQVIKDSSRCYIFFDDKFSKKTYEDIMDRLMSAEEENRMIERTTIVYADEGNQADQKMRNKVKELTQTMPTQSLSNIVLVTADRILVQECYEIHPLKRSSGIYFIKFMKKSLKKEARMAPYLKKYIKRILNYGE